MNYKFGNSNKIYEQGSTAPLTCPKCNKKVEFAVLSNFEGRLKGEFPFFDSSNVYILVCPECSSLFTVDEEKGKQFKKGEKLAIGNFDLKEPKKYER
jgi:uncharacterized protein YbaR (Trm112 family)